MMFNVTRTEFLLYVIAALTIAVLIAWDEPWIMGRI
ncbi:hypothetical protein ACVIHH_001047 [Bradyrhizobium sp. USDA 4518]|jgi:hypothetical protein|nr:hypothetical protein [Bradyrhizobium elkanii]MCP1837162.1 hypothetical protein [Bradyrhizobium sp. USDA 4538]MCP1853321.1 hypothetical protein [Bradyrhizobium sp. USDA 4541]MCP1906180.1 hypothetical protein [Bradyrhizobium sp. USDA 4537]MCP1988165.1 hypothetical protein [Bradyrhizobium sp. USDA 4539]MCS4006093.1 hypothetical protein [Bradyrhizobium elkanii USDA 61]